LDIKSDERLPYLKILSILTIIVDGGEKTKKKTKNKRNGMTAENKDEIKLFLSN
ncbi:hypothetical protein DOY81_013480, partial [Sarcophaga bullata]